MKSQKHIFGISFLAILLSLNTIALGQRGLGRGMGYGYGTGQGSFYDLPNLTTEQDQKIGELQTTFWKDMNGYQNQYAEKSVHLNSLQSSDQADITSINKTIDEISVIQASMAKRQAKHNQSIRKLLTSDQKIYFDRFYGGNGYGRGQGYGRGRGFAGCQGFGRGRGFGAAQGYGRGRGFGGATQGYGRGPGSGTGQGYGRGRGYGAGLNYGRGQGYGQGQGRYWDNY